MKIEYLGPLNIIGYCKECNQPILDYDELPEHAGVYECECGQPQTIEEMNQQ